MKKVLIIGKTQFGYHIDSFYYCKYLVNTFQITYICFDENLSRIENYKINIIYVSLEGNFFKRAIRFYRTIWAERRKKYNAYFLIYFLGCCFSGLIFRSNVILDIRSACVAKPQIKRNILDLILRIESILFMNISIITKGLANYLGIKYKIILPLGAVEISKINFKGTKLKLLYVGTLSNRQIVDTIEGVALYFRETKNEITYTIVGFGSAVEESEIQNAIQKFGLEEIVNFVGRVPVNMLAYYFDNHNVGIAYVPLKPYFDHQPSTKIFEYGLSGIPIIATCTSENRKLITTENGVICHDNPDSFCQAIYTMNDRLTSYDSEYIRKHFQKYHWETIVTKILNPFITKILN